MEKRNYAIIGSGISGLSAAYILHKKYNITLFEASCKLGGHTNTKYANDGTPIDTGFIVFNEQNYPYFCKFLDALGVTSIQSNMSFAYFDSKKNTGYSSDFPGGVFSTKKHCFSPSFYRFLWDIHRFNTISKQALLHLSNDQTIQEYLERHGFSHRLINEYVLPMGAAIWSTSQRDMASFPAKSFLSFWNNHSLLQFFNRPIWRTITGGSQKYIDAVIQQTKISTFLNHPIHRIDRSDSHVTLYGTSSEPMDFDGVIIATHADQALRMLSKPSKNEQNLLKEWRYSKNNTVLHTSDQHLPKHRSAWASWIYTRDNDNEMSATYWMNRLQSLKNTTNYFVTLNSHADIPNSAQLFSTVYEHPIMAEASMNTQSQLPSLNGYMNTYFCGSYFGNGFHEDGIASSVAVGKALGCSF